MNTRLFETQSALRARYKQAPELALVTAQARTRSDNPADPFHLQVVPALRDEAAVPVGVHGSVGGPYDAPCPGDLLCAALAACYDASVRMVAQAMGIELTALEVHVQAKVDMRGAMGMGRDLPVGFQSFSTDIHLKAREGTPAEAIEQLRVAAQRCCVVAHTLRSAPEMQTRFHA
jgi:uncharacterized OsmC-like protein